MRYSRFSLPPTRGPFHQESSVPEFLTDESGAPAVATPSLRAALGEYDTAWHDPALSVRRAKEVIAAAGRLKARLVVLPEMCTTGFTMEAGRWAEVLGAQNTANEAIATAAREHHLWVLAGLALRETSPTRLVNAAVLFDPSGSVAAIYRKQRLFAYSGEHEVYSPGDAPVVAAIEGVRVGLFVCYDLRFPELFRAVASDIDVAIVIANWPERRRAHWDVLTRARAIENQCYVVAVNRTGIGDGVEYDGGSVAYDAWGEPVGIGGGGNTPRVVDIDPGRVKLVRARYPFLRELEASREALAPVPALRP
jgi:predicted amidohydrolase